MSHFCGLVIMTPEYAENNTFEDSLEKYNENIEYEPYMSGEVSDYERVRFLEYYNKDKVNEDAIKNEFVDTHAGIEGFQSFEDFKNEWGSDDRNCYVHTLAYDHKDEYCKFFIEKFPELFADFDNQYEEHGEDWNSSCWKKNDNGVWEKWSTYNPDSKWDWYSLGGRWGKSIKTKSGEFVDKCFLDEIDWSPFKPEDYEEETQKDWSGKEYHPLKDSVQYHYTENDVPFCVIIDGVWYERGKMGWWTFVSDEKEKGDWNEEFMTLVKTLPEKSLVANYDFHI